MPSHPRRAVLDDADLPAPTESKGRTPQRAAQSHASVWLSLLMAPVVVVASVALGWAAQRVFPQGAASHAASRVTSSPSPANTPVIVKLNDAHITAPGSWRVTHDTLVEKDRRAVVLSHPSGATLQALTMPKTQETLEQTCSTLLNLQTKNYSEVSITIPANISVTGNGEGISCGYQGTRGGTTVFATFNIIRRHSDHHLLLLRTIVPTTTDAALPEIGLMQCEASRSFGVVLPLC